VPGAQAGAATAAPGATRLASPRSIACAPVRPRAAGRSIGRFEGSVACPPVRRQRRC
jgi:hypothetical protein